jgi:DNA mismatch repair protein MLH3
MPTQYHSCDAPTSQPAIVDAVSGALPHRFSKADLCRARIVNQVDRKFIVCLVEDRLTDDGNIEDYDPSLVGRALVLIDQHAADERVRVERFLKELCQGFLYNRAHGHDPVNGVRTRELSPPKPLLLTVHEAWRLKNSSDIQQAFLLWGFRFLDLSPTQEPSEDESRDSDVKYMQVRVHAIPEVVANKVWISVRMPVIFEDVNFRIIAAAW